MASRELRVVGAWFPFNCSLFKRKLINHQPSRCYWKVVPLLRMLDPAFFEDAPKMGALYFSWKGGFVLFLGFFFFSMSNQTAWGCVFLFSYNSFWVGSQSVRIQTSPPLPPGALVTW